uniref:Ninjurin 2 n=1 Tax=Podarcis muralis TaxID=64176 RepID=A0A670JI22_PODMU
MGSEGEMINLHPSIPGSRLENIININHYATKKSVAESMLDVALFMANAAQLKAVLEQGTSFQYYAVLTALITISLFFQTVIGILLIIIGKHLSADLFAFFKSSFQGSSYEERVIHSTVLQCFSQSSSDVTLSHLPDFKHCHVIWKLGWDCSVVENLPG